MLETLKSMFGARGVDAEALARIDRGALVVDVRTPEEFASGHFRNAKNVPVQELSGRARELPKDRAIVLYCRSGARSASAKRVLDGLGYRDVYDAGGMHNLG